MLTNPPVLYYFIYKVGAFSVIVQPVVEPMDRFTALIQNTDPTLTHGKPLVQRPAGWCGSITQTCSLESGSVSSCRLRGRPRPGRHLAYKHYTQHQQPKSPRYSLSGGFQGLYKYTLHSPSIVQHRGLSSRIACMCVAR